MARINFEDDVESQDQFWELLKHVDGDRDRALGMLIRFFRVAQTAYGQGEPMTADFLEQRGFQCMIESGWAVPCEGGYQSLGAEKHFGWYRQRVAQASDAGKKSAMARREKYGSAQPNRHRTDRSDSPNRNEPTPNPLSLSLSLSLTNDDDVGAKQAVIPTDPVSDFLDKEVKAEVRAFWSHTLGEKLIAQELPLAATYWMTNQDKRKPGDTFPRFALAWIQREKKNPRTIPAPPIEKAHPEPAKTKLVHKEIQDPDTGEVRIEFLQVPV